MNRRKYLMKTSKVSGLFPKQSQPILSRENARFTYDSEQDIGIEDQTRWSKVTKKVAALAVSSLVIFGAAHCSHQITPEASAPSEATATAEPFEGLLVEGDFSNNSDDNEIEVR
jgi:hypothetical protein